MLKSGNEYLESLRDGRIIYIGGEKVDDVTAHPGFRNGALSFARIWDARFHPRYRDLLTYEEDGQRYPMYYLRPRSRADLERRTRSHEAIADLSYGLLGRSPDFVAGYVTGAAMQTQEFNWKSYTFSDNVSRYFEHCRRNDLYLSHATHLHAQPLPPRELDAMAEVRRAIGVPLMADESIRTPRDAMEVIRRGAADIANVYVTEAGGLLNASRIFTLCEAAGMPCMIGSMPEFGIGTAAQIHLGVAMPNLGPDSDTCGVLYHAEDLLARPLRIEGGYAYPPEGPGLGVEIDMDVLERWRRNAPPGVSA